MHVFQDDSDDLPPFSLIDVSLPLINNFQIGFSGVCALNDTELLFTSSLEETTDFTKDGTIEGSYIGILKLVNDTTVNLVSFTNFNATSGISVTQKLESIEVINTQGKTIHAIAVADNDNGTSKMFYLSILRNK